MSKKITFAIKALILKEDKFLIVKRTQENPTVWELPGGHLECGDGEYQLLHKEFQRCMDNQNWNELVSEL